MIFIAVDFSGILLLLLYPAPGVGEIDPDYAEALLAPNLKKYPQVSQSQCKGSTALTF